MRLRLRIATALALLLALCVVLPAAASAASRDQIIHDCTDGTLDGHYTQKELADTIAHLPADADEYTDCRDVLKRGQLSGGGGSGGGSGTSGPGVGGGTTGGGTGAAGDTGTGDTGTGVTGGGVDPLAGATAAEKAAFQKAVAAGSTPVKLDGRPIHPGELGGAKTSGVGDLPKPLVAVLALLIIAGLGAAGFGTRRLVLGRRTA